ncbi:ankyrin repeat domain-containing protein 16 isoform X1 [Alosa sapidissima]|uniref:ankyrin repeat domain-containing protein 16 isoform X1 n=1 Tax=Alosa sapidissima TaxID=34773 RepID=UPI001C09F99E|nr:ankyrin repeat domain-containing protein 16 isoform X1 [Alosa sapidissima]
MENISNNLIKFVQYGQLCLLKEELEANIDIRHSVISGHFGRSGDTLLHYAARHGHLDILTYLVEIIDMDIELHNNDYKRPIHEASSMSHARCVSYLLERGAKVDSLKKADWTPLMMACTRRSLEVIELLLKWGANLSLKNKDGWTAFHIACREGDSVVIQRLLLANCELWRTESKTKRTPLHTAALHGCEDVVQILLERSEYERDSRDSCGVTPFMDAVRSGHISTARLLLEKHQASPIAVDVLGVPPLHQVCVTGQEGALRYLVQELGVDVNTRATNMQLTALHYATKEGHTNTVKTLLELGADLYATDTKGRTALHMASIGQHADTAAALLALGLVDSADSSGVRAIQLARKPAVKSVLENHAQNTP